jgi:hypothetical protein
MGVMRVDSVEELKQQVAATQKQLAGLYLDEHVSATWLFYFYFYWCFGALCFVSVCRVCGALQHISSSLHGGGAGGQC